VPKLADAPNGRAANGNGRAPLPYFDPQAAQVTALKRAVDNALAIQQYAKEQNLPLGSPTFEDIRTMAAVLFINESKVRRGF
jgi:hypothetical protein